MIDPKDRDAIQWNPPERLAPVGCPLILNLGPQYDWDIAFAERISHLQGRGDEMEYQTEFGQIITGRFLWAYP